MDPILTTIGIAALTALGIDVLNDRFEPLRNITHGNIISESTKQLNARLDEILENPDLLRDFTSRRSNYGIEDRSGFEPTQG